MSSIKNLVIPYPDFKLNDIIDPEQFDVNNADIVEKINEVITNINSHIGSTTLPHPDASVTSSKIASNAITTVKIKDGVITSAKLDPLLLSQISGGSGGNIDLSGFQLQLNNQELIYWAGVE